MIITRTPFRISFFGGGTDYKPWYLEHGGAVLATTIDKYCYVSCRKLPPFFEHKHRIVYSKIENVQKIEEIIHPAVRTIFDWMQVDDGLEIHHDGDLPARSGIGSSSSFAVGLIHAIRAARGQLASKYELARDALYVEQDLIKENVGSQDQISAAYGGFNRINFLPSGDFSVSPVILAADRLAFFQKHFMLFFTGVTRIASQVAKSTIDNIATRQKELKTMHGMVDRGIDILRDPTVDLVEFGRLLDEAWLYKRSLSEEISNPEIDDLVATAKAAGAVGGKLLGAGAGGFLLLFVRPQDQPKVHEALRRLVHVPFNFEHSGSTVALYQPNGL